MTKYIGKVVLLDTGLYHNLALAEGCTVACEIEEFGDGHKQYNVAPDELARCGCDVTRDVSPFPFFGDEVEEV